MKLTLLGTGSSQGVPIIGCHCHVCRSEDSLDRRLRTCAFVETEKTKILIDAGPDLRQQLLTHEITQIDAILLTHEHKDHTGGLDDIRPINFLRKQSIDVYGLKRTLKSLKSDYNYAFQTQYYPGTPSMNLHLVRDEPFLIAGITIIPINVMHLAMPILGYRIGDIGYITDASFIEENELNKLKKLKILVINALRIKEHYSHFNLSQALAYISILNPEQAYITHIGHYMGKYRDVNPILPQNIHLGYDGLTIQA